MKKEFKLLLSDLKIIDGDRGTNYPKKTDFKNEGYCLFLNAGNISKNGFNDSKCEFITKEKSDLLGKGFIQENDIILTTRGSVGNFVYIDNEVIKKYPRIRVNSGMVIIRNCNADISTEYLYYLLNSNNFSKEIEKSISGGVLKQLPINVIKNMSLIYTENNKTEQIKITNKIIKAEIHIKNIKSLLKKIEIRNQYYADKLLNKEIPENYTKLKIIDICDITTGRKDANEGNENGLYEFFTCSLENKKISNYSYDQEAILISGNGDPGVCKYYNGKFDAYQRVYILSEFKLNAKYLFKILKLKFKESIKNSMQGGVIQYIKLGDISNFEFYYPNDNDTLIKNMDILESLENEKQKIEKLLKLEEKRFEWLSDKLLSGEYIIDDDV